MQKNKLSLLLIVISIISLTACNAIKNAVTARTPQINIPFSCDFCITAYDDMELKGTMTRLGTGMWEMNVTSPESMSGLNIKRNDTGMDVSLGELEICIDQSKINQGAFAELIFKAIDSCAALSEITLEESENGLEYTGKVSECPFIMTFSADTMIPTGISFPSINLEVIIDNFSPSTNQDISETTPIVTEQTAATVST